MKGQLESIEAQMPYSLKDDSMGYMQDVDYGCDLDITGTQCMFKGSDIEIKLSITYSLSVYSKEMMNVLSNVNMTEEPIEPRKGVTVYFAKKVSGFGILQVHIQRQWMQLQKRTKD